MRGNKEAVGRILLLIGMIGCFVFLILTKRINHYVHPRMKKYVILSIILLIGMFWFELPQLKKTKHRNHLAQYGKIVLPLVMMCVIVPVQLNRKPKEATSYASRTQQSQVEEGGGQAETLLNEEKTMNIEEDIVPEEMIEEMDTGNLYPNGYKVADEEYGNWLLEVYEHIYDYVGQEVTFKAQVLYDESLEEGEIVAARGIMTCCIADVGYYGYVCKDVDTSVLNEWDWIWVKGKFELETYEQTGELVIVDAEITKAEAPVDEYAYFY